MRLLPIYTRPARNQPYRRIPECLEMLSAWEAYYPKIKFRQPWIGYFVEVEGEIVGGGGFKGPPRNKTIEIAYGVFPGHEGKGIGKRICRSLVELSLTTDPAIRITARTLPENNASGAILTHNGFIKLGIVQDPEDGEVWEWEYMHVA